MQPVVVYDTNILFSAIGWRGSPHLCLEMARQGRVTGLTCQEILDELAEKLPLKLGLTLSETTDKIKYLAEFLQPVKISNTLKVVDADADDDKVIECAVVGLATHIVSGDHKHVIPLGNYQNIRIVTAREFLDQFS